MIFAFSCKETSLASQSLEEIPTDHKIKSLGALLVFFFLLCNKKGEPLLGL